VWCFPHLARAGYSKSNLIQEASIELACVAEKAADSFDSETRCFRSRVSQVRTGLWPVWAKSLQGGKQSPEKLEKIVQRLSALNPYSHHHNLHESAYHHLFHQHYYLRTPPHTRCLWPVMYHSPARARLTRDWMPECCHGSGRFPTHLITTEDNGYHLLDLCGLQPVDIEAQSSLILLATFECFRNLHSWPSGFLYKPLLLMALITALCLWLEAEPAFYSSNALSSVLVVA
jgi:hypothetical protein